MSDGDDDELDPEIGQPSSSEPLDSNKKVFHYLAYYFAANYSIENYVFFSYNVVGNIVLVAKSLFSAERKKVFRLYFSTLTGPKITS